MMRLRKSSFIHVFSLISIVFLSLTILYNQFSFQQIHQDHPLEYSDMNFSSFQQKLPTVAAPDTGHLDKSTTCTSTVEYSGRRAFFPVVGRPESRVPALGGPLDGCDLFSGRWVFDNTSYPLYEESDCPYMSDQLACQRHGRPDSDYYHWRWQPHNCDIKRWNVSEIWEKLRGKRVMFVGDSLNRGQWISMLCLLHSILPSDKQSITPQAQLTIFTAEEYNATIEFQWLPLLVESNSDDPVDHRLPERILRPDSLVRYASQWNNADILVFNSYLWWKQGPVKLLWSSEIENGVCEEISGVGGMRLAMEAWADWVESTVDTRRQKVFFVTMSPTHMFKGEWEVGNKGGNCYNEKHPINTTENERWSGFVMDNESRLMQKMVDEVLRRLSSKVTVINITGLSSYRKDGHPTIYRKFWEALNADKLSNPGSYSDCIHWCLPGVPDTWNQLLFQFL